MAEMSLSWEFSWDPQMARDLISKVLISRACWALNWNYEIVSDLSDLPIKTFLHKQMGKHREISCPLCPFRKPFSL